MGLIDIVVMVLVVVIVVTRFTKFKLPKDLRDSTARKADLERLRGRPLVRDDAPTAMKDVTPEEVKPVPKKPTLRELQAAAKDLTGIAKIKALEPSFTEEDFLEGAKGAYRYYVSCWNAKDEDGLENLCAPALFGRVQIQLQDDAVWQEILLDSLEARVADARVHGKTMVVDVDFEAVEREGSSSARAVHRRWVLARPLGSDDPNWELQDIRTTVDA